MKKTKIVCTMGPNTNDRISDEKVNQNGMECARLTSLMVIMKSKKVVWIC